MRFTKEIKAGLIAVLAIVILILGVNFLKGNSFFGGDVVYYSYFPNSGQLMVSSNVTLNGVVVGKVTAVDYRPQNKLDKRVRVTFNIQNDDVYFPKGTIIEIGSLDLFSKGLLIQIPANITGKNYKVGDAIPGRLSVDMVSQVKAYADPISQRLQAMMSSVDKMVGSLSAFWDDKATSEIEGSLREVKITIHKLGNLATEMGSFVDQEKAQFSRILSNVENITQNLKKSNEQITSVIGNVKVISDDMVGSNFKSVILDAQTTLKKINMILDETSQGKGSLGKLIHDEKLYNELVETNQELQELVDDLEKHPERYVNISVIGRKSKGLHLTSTQEKKLEKLLDTIPE